MQSVVRGENAWCAYHLPTTVDGGYETAGLAYQEHTGGYVPRIQATFPESLVAAGSDIGQIKRCRTKSANPGGYRHDCLELAEK